MAEPLVSVCMIARDEESTIGRALASCVGLEGELVVVDTGSTDRTADVAASFGARVAHVPWQDDFAAARNASLDLARGAWVVVVDADEYFPDGEAARLRQTLASAPEHVAAFTVRIDSLAADGSPELKERQRALRAFRNRPAHRYALPVHEQIAHRLTGTLAAAPVRLLHTGYTPEAVAAKDKVARNRRLLEGLLSRLGPDDAHRPFACLELASERLRTGDRKGALPLLAEAWAAFPAMAARPENRAAATGLAVAYGRLLVAEGRPAEGLAVAEAALGAGLDAAALQFTRGWAELGLGQTDAAVHHLLATAERCERSGEADEDAPAAGEVGAVRAMAGEALWRAGRAAEAATVVARALRSEPRHPHLLDLATRLVEDGAVPGLPWVARLPHGALYPLAERAVEARRFGAAAAARAALAEGRDPLGQVVEAALALTAGDAPRALAALARIPAGSPAATEGAFLEAVARKRTGGSEAAVLAALGGMADREAAAACAEVLTGRPGPRTAAAQRVRQAAAHTLGVLQPEVSEVKREDDKAWR